MTFSFKTVATYVVGILVLVACCYVCLSMSVGTWIGFSTVDWPARGYGLATPLPSP